MRFGQRVVVTVAAYVSAILFTGKDPRTDREFLIIFNALLIGVMAIILFSVSETTESGKNRINSIILFLLSITTIVVNGIALSAVVFRIAEWGITPNRMAVLGENILMLINLALVSIHLFHSIRDEKKFEQVENSIASYLPIYAVWIVIVVFVFPFIFSFA